MDESISWWVFAFYDLNIGNDVATGAFLLEAIILIWFFRPPRRHWVTQTEIHWWRRTNKFFINFWSFIFDSNLSLFHRFVLSWFGQWNFPNNPIIFLCLFWSFVTQLGSRCEVNFIIWKKFAKVWSNNWFRMLDVAFLDMNNNSFSLIKEETKWFDKVTHFMR